MVCPAVGMPRIPAGAHVRQGDSGIAMVVFLAVGDWTGASGWRERKRSPSRRQTGIEPVQHVLVHEAFALLIQDLMALSLITI